jgi:hypothetical protein
MITLDTIYNLFRFLITNLTSALHYTVHYHLATNSTADTHSSYIHHTHCTDRVVSSLILFSSLSLKWKRKLLSLINLTSLTNQVTNLDLIFISAINAKRTVSNNWQW